MYAIRRFLHVALFAWCLASSAHGFMPTCPSTFRTVSGRRTGRQQLFTSLSVPPSSSNEASVHNDDAFTPGKRNGRRRNNRDTSPSHHFRSYLRNLTRNLRSSRTCATIMDDELERMELRWYGGEATAPPRYTGRPREYYRGSTVQPDLSCFAMVANAYAKAGLGIRGAELAEQVLKRCEEHVQQDETAQKPNTFLWTAVMNAWARADRWDKADYWLQHIENTFARSQRRRDAPDVFTYTTYLEALAVSRRKNGTEIAQSAKKMLERMHQMADSGDNVHARPNAYTYVAAIKCQARENGSIEEVVGLLRSLQNQYRTSGDISLKPGAMAYTPVLLALQRCGGGMEAARRADALKDELHDIYEQTGDRDYHPHDGIYTAVISAYSRVEPEERSAASKRVDELLEQVENDPLVRRAVQCYTAAINAKTQDGLPSGPEEAERILRRMFRPDTIAYQCVIKAYARAGNAERAEALLNEMEELAADRRLVNRANAITHAACIHAWVKEYKRTRSLAAVERADAILHQIVGLYRDGLVRYREKNVDHAVFDTVLQTLAFSRHPEAGERAEKILAAMEQMTKFVSDEGEMYRPSAYSHTYTLDAWAGSGHPDAGNRTLDLLQRMQDLHSEDQNYPAPNSRSISSALTSVTKTGGAEAIDVAEELLHRRLQLYEEGDRSSIPNARTYTSVLGLIVRSHEPDAGKRALELFRYIRDVSDRHRDKELAPNAITYNCVLHGFVRSGELDGAEQLFAEMKARYKAGHKEEKPGVVTYSTMVEALGRSDSVDAPRRAEALLDEMESLYRAGDNDLKPDTQIFNSVIRTIANSVEKDPTAVEKAHNLLKRMEMSLTGDEKIVPDLISYSTVCYAYANSNSTVAAEKAREILEHVEELSESGAIKPPDLPLYSVVILAYTRNKQQESLHKAEALFNHMEDLYKSGRNDLKPNNRIMNQLICGWATSKNKDKAQHANAVLQRMKSMYEAGNLDVRPGVISYNWVIRAAARSTRGSRESRVKIFRIAVEQFKSLHQQGGSVRPNAGTYIYFLRACKSLLPTGDVRDKLIGDTFALASKNGVVSNNLFKQVKQLAPSVLRNALEREGVELDVETISDVPEKWRRHCSGFIPS